MTDHLPECPHAEPDLSPGFLVMCICSRLRACEQRVEEAWSAIAGQDQYAKGYAAGLDAAREAVAEQKLVPLAKAGRFIIYRRSTGEAMTDHLPECSESMIPDFHNERWICICDQLRACQQRMALQYLITDREQQEAEERAYVAGLDAAREAVKNTRCPEGYEAVGCSHWEEALAAIDALREKKP